MTTKTEACPDCQARGEDNAGNNRVIFPSGRGYWCFNCEKGTPRDVEEEDLELLEVVPAQSLNRRISERTMRYTKCGQAQYTGWIGFKDDGRMCNNEWVHVFPVHVNGKLVAQKLITRDKKFTWKGKAKGDLPLFLQELWSPNPNMFVTVVEGEYDALTCLQVQGYQFPVVSVRKGAGSAAKELAANLGWLLGFKYVVLGFDTDEAGHKAVRDCLELFEPGKVRVAEWRIPGFQGKDANDLLQANKADEVKNILFRAKEIVPDNVVTIKDRLSAALVQPQYGIKYPWDTMTAWTFGMQPGEINVIVGPEGVGKTGLVNQMVFNWLDQGIKVGFFSFEFTPAMTIQRLVSAKIHVKIYKPGEVWDEKLIKETAETFDDKIYFYDKAGQADITDLLNSIRYLVLARGVTVFVIDNLKALAVATDMEIASSFTRRLKSMALELQFDVWLVSHVNKDGFNKQLYLSTSPKNPMSYYGKSASQTDDALKKPGIDWESGRMPTSANVEGSNAITAYADYIWGLARNKVSDDKMEKSTLYVKMLKSGKIESEFCGNKFALVYTKEGVLQEKGVMNTEVFK